MIKNLGNEIFSIIKQLSAEKRNTFTRTELSDIIDARFECEKGRNLKKRMYDILNIYISLGMLKKNGKTFTILNTLPGKTKWSKSYQMKYNRLTKKIEEGRELHFRVSKKQAKLEELKSRLEFTKFYINHNQEASRTKFYKIGKAKKLVEGEKRKFKLPFSILKVDEQPRIVHNSEDGSTQYFFKDFKAIKDFQLLKLNTSETNER